MELDPTVFTKLLGDSTLAGILFFCLRSLWSSKQEGDKALIAYLETSNKENLAAKQQQIESYDRLTNVIGELTETIEKRQSADDQRNQEVDRRLTTIEAEVFPTTPVRRLGKMRKETA